MCIIFLYLKIPKCKITKKREFILLFTKKTILTLQEISIY